MSMEVSLQASNTQIIDLPTDVYEPREQNYLVGKYVEWVIDLESRGCMDKIAAYALNFFISLFLILSVVGMPLFILGYREFILQNVETDKKAQIQKLYEQVKGLEGYKELASQRIELLENAAAQDLETHDKLVKESTGDKEKLKTYLATIKDLELKLKIANKDNKTSCDIAETYKKSKEDEVKRYNKDTSTLKQNWSKAIKQKQLEINELTKNNEALTQENEILKQKLAAL